MKTLFVILLILTATHGLAQENGASEKLDAVNNAAASKQAQTAVAAFRMAWNTADNDKVREVIHFPFVTVTRGGRVIVAKTSWIASCCFA